jgi:hypothetical protein
MTATTDDDTRGEKLSETVFAQLQHPGGCSDASIELESFDSSDDDVTQIVVDVGAVSVTVGLAPRQLDAFVDELEQHRD